MIKVAITGNIASGKSEVQNIISNLDSCYPVFDADLIAHDLLDNIPEIKELAAGLDVFDEYGKIDRTKLGNIVFKDKVLLNKLEKIIHPAVKQKIEDIFYLNKNSDIIFVAIPLLYETNMDKMFDKVILIYSDDKIRINRLMLNRGYSEDYAHIRINSQLSQDEKLKYADYVIKNNLTVKELSLEVCRIISLIKNEYKK